MAGTRFKVEIDDAAVRRTLERIVAAGEDLTPALEDIGEALLASHFDRWRREEAPDGTPWAPLSPKYAARKARKRPNAGILVFDDLLRSLAWQVQGDELELGTGRVYGATHQFGRGGIPARPFLGLSGDDEAEVLEILRRHLADAIPGGGT